MFVGVGVAIAGFVAYTVVKASSQQRRTVGQQRATVSQAALDAAERVKQRLIALHSGGCDHVVESTTVTVGETKHVLSMSAGGNCLRALAAAPRNSKLTAKLVTPTGAEKIGKVTDAFVEIEHCPVDDGQHTFVITADELAYALVDCAPAREKYRDDPAQNGFALVGARMEQLEKSGCPTVLMPPKTFVAERSMTATMEPGRFCAVIIAASAKPNNSLTAAFTTPFGRPIDVPPPSSFVEIVYCATDSGPHGLKIIPSMLEYYSIGAMDCPRRVANKLPAR